MARDIYNLIWVTPETGTATIGPAPQHTMATTETRRSWTRGVILFPSFLTPLVHVVDQDEPFLELLIATELTLTADMVNRQLKISAQLRPEKPYAPAPLFPGAHGFIEVAWVSGVSSSRTKILETDSKFEGILHPSYARALRDKNIGKIYRVKVDASAIPDSSPSDELNYSVTERKFIGYRRGSDGAARRVGPALRGRELSDVMIREMLGRRFGADNSSNPNPIPGRGRYAFPMRGNTVDVRNIDPNSPIQSYHPLVVLTGEHAKPYLDFGHVSDIHINTRWQFLGKSPARMIEYGEGQYEDESPKIGTILAENNRNFHNVLSRVCARADLMVVGGDLIDHIRNTYNANRALASSSTVREVWDTMDLEGDAYTQTSYPVGIDLIAFYSFVYDAMTQHSMPFFAITGNHDCYVEAFGISPRVAVPMIASSRTNEGIPADLNLTFYEALLAFGPSGGLLVQMSSSFEHEWFDWFHLVLTPFNDWWFKLPHQSLVGLGWGDSEDLYADEQGMGHLPRSEDGVSAGQLALLNRAVGERDQRKVTLTSHFTFLSFADNIAMDPPGSTRHATGRFSSGLTPYTDHELGTFETNRGALIDMLTGGQIQCVLTGHSHRRGLYLLGDSGMTGIQATLYDTDPNNPNGLATIPERLREREPFVIVSDSAGPYPRHNRAGEFSGWGSDRPGGTVIQFNEEGFITRARTVSAEGRAKPRAAVSMDYVDVSMEGVFNDNRMQTNYVSGDVIAGRSTGTWVINANFTTEVHNTWRIYIEKLIFAGFHNDAWIRIETRWDAAHNGFLVPADRARDFYTWVRTIQSPTRYVSLKLGTHSQFMRGRYDWGSHWNFEVEVEMDWEISGWSRQYCFYIQRPQRAIAVTGRDINWRESPNFDWRRAHDPKYA